MRIRIELINGIRLSGAFHMQGEKAELVKALQRSARYGEGQITIDQGGETTIVPSRNIAYIVLKEDQ